MLPSRARSYEESSKPTSIRRLLQYELSDTPRYTERPPRVNKQNKALGCWPQDRGGPPEAPPPPRALAVRPGRSLAVLPRRSPPARGIPIGVGFPAGQKKKKAACLTPFSLLLLETTTGWRRQQQPHPHLLAAPRHFPRLLVPRRSHPGTRSGSSVRGERRGNTHLKVPYFVYFAARCMQTERRSSREETE